MTESRATRGTMTILRSGAAEGGVGEFRYALASAGGEKLAAGLKTK
ncbi:MAG: hypothetical protein HY336_01465 [Candidatus Doudnabacteria bacterium]|nr:hypothetical protein [Candidatus Doudnabacteria bacterium]